MVLLNDVKNIKDILNTFVCGDALEFVKKLPDKSVDVVCTSPPFWRQRDYECEGQQGLELTPKDYLDNLLVLFKEVKRVVKKKGAVWVNIGDSYNENSGGYFDDKKNTTPHVGKHRFKTDKFQKEIPRRSLLMIPYQFAIKMIYEQGWCCRNEIIWKKKIVQPTAALNRFTVDFEPIFLFTHSSKYYFNKEAVKWINDDDLFEVQGKERRCVWDLDSDYKGKTGHKAPYPADLVKIPILASCPKNGVVLDFFSGSGTTALVAKQLGFNFLACDLNPDFCAKAEKRLSSQ